MKGSSSLANLKDFSVFCWVDLGLLPYEIAWNLQLRLLELRIRRQITDVLILCEHPEVITVGRRKESMANVHLANVPVFEVERGGDVTYHAPQQLIGYPVLELEDKNLNPTSYLRLLESAVVELCHEFGVGAKAKQGMTGVWTQDEQRKIASLGISVRKGVAFHGFALNACVDLAGFFRISPCGLPASTMTSLQRENPLYTEEDMPKLKEKAALILGAHIKKPVQKIASSLEQFEQLLSQVQ